MICRLNSRSSTCLSVVHEFDVNLIQFKLKNKCWIEWCTHKTSSVAHETLFYYKHFSCTWLALHTSSLQQFNSNTRFEILFFFVVIFFSSKWKVQPTTKLHMFMCTLNEKEKMMRMYLGHFLWIKFFFFFFHFIFIILQIHCKLLLKTYYQLSNFFSLVIRYFYVAETNFVHKTVKLSI